MLHTYRAAVSANRVLVAAISLVAMFSTAASATPVPLANPTATVEQGGFPVTQSLTNDGLGWATSSAPAVAVYQTSPVLPVPIGYFPTFTFTLDSDNTTNANHVLGKFRLSYTQSPAPTTVSVATWVQLPPSTAVAVSSNPVVFLANNVLEATDVNANFDIITVTAMFIPSSPTSITGFRLEAIQDITTGSYPGPGIPGNNNIVFDFFGVDVVFTLIPVPEPSTFALLGLGAIGLAIRARRHRAVV